MSLNDWLNSTLGEAAPPNFRAPYDPRQQQQHMLSQGFSQESREVADIHQRLDAITQQIERISKPAPRQDSSRERDVSREQGVARQLNDAISRLDARLSQISRPQPQAQQPQAPRPAPSPVDMRQRQADAVERAAAQVYRGSPPLSPASFDVAVAEITARQSELDGFTPRHMPPRAAPSIAPAAPYAPAMAPPAPAYAPPPQPGPDFSSLERHLLKITSQIESLQRPDNTEQAISAFRGELAEIRQAITEAMPRRAIESIENEIRSLHRRIDETRSNGTDGQVLSGIERALSDIKQVLRTLTPAEQLTGYDEAIRNLGAKLDLILRANDDPSTVRQLEDAISALRAIVSNVASNEALARLSEDVQLLSSKVDQITRASGQSDSFAVLEQRIAALTAALETRERPQPSESTEHLEAAIRALSDRFDRMQVGNDSASTFAHLEQRVSYLLERIEAAADPRNGNLSRVEDGLHDILRHLERQQATYSALAESRNSAPPADSGVVDLVKRELSDIRYSQAETNRSTQDSLEAVHSALGHVVDRLSMIEGDLRAVRTAPPAPAPQPMPMATSMAMPMEPAPMAREPRPQAQQQPKYDPKPELPNPAAAQHPPHSAFVAAPREFHAAAPAAPPPVPAAPPVPPRAISEILEPHTAPARAAIAPELPPDHPLEPGTRPGGRAATPSERIAASESAISEIPAAPKEPVSSSSFIAAARRAAQAAAAQPPEKPARGVKAAIAGRAKDKGQSQEGSSTITSKIRSLLVGASVVVIVLGTFKMAMNLLEGGGPAPAPQAMENSSPAPAPQPAPPPVETKPAAPEQITPSMTSPTPIGRQSQNNAAPAPMNNSGSTASVEIPPAPAVPPPPAASSDVTGALSGMSRAKLGTIQVPPSEKLPDGIGGPGLRTAAMKGDATAAYEIGLRFAEGKGVATNYDEAAKWYDRAAQAGVVPATFRLGTLYEKGLGVKKDADIARRYYTQAAERGNAKAMHNLAVLDADGGGRGANYKGAAQWFRKAADRGVADSQFNLGILYARGIGVEQNLAESYKWFSLAAAQGDADAAGKRDDVAKRLDPQSLAAAKLAIQTFSAEPQPDDAVNVPAPNGGWDSASQASAKPAPKQVATKRSASAAH